MRKMEVAQIDKASKAFVRVDLDVPIEKGAVKEINRLNASLPTLEYLVSKKARITIAGHMGRPKNREPELSTSQLKGFFDQKLQGYEYILLENLRYDAREESLSEDYAKELAADNNLYINDSFATSHRNHTSIVGIPKLIPGYAGITLQKEVENINKVLVNPQRPLIAIVGGAKIESKKPVIEKFLKICDFVLVGGKIGIDWKDGQQSNLILPVDYETDKKDIGLNTCFKFTELIRSAKTIIWAGPMGLFEEPMYAKGTRLVAEAVLDSGAYSLIGGGDTARALEEINMLDKFSYVSTGGGALLEYIVNGTLPGIEVLK